MSPALAFTLSPFNATGSLWYTAVLHCRPQLSLPPCPYAGLSIGINDLKIGRRLVVTTDGGMNTKRPRQQGEERRNFPLNPAKFLINSNQYKKLILLQFFLNWNGVVISTFNVRIERLC